MAIITDDKGYEVVLRIRNCKWGKRIFNEIQMYQKAVVEANRKILVPIVEKLKKGDKK